MVQRMKGVSFSLSLDPISWANLLLIRVIAQSLDTAGLGQLISVQSVERSGGDWYLWVRTGDTERSRLCRYPAKSISINGISLDHFLEDIVTKGI